MLRGFRPSQCSHCSGDACSIRKVAQYADIDITDTDGRKKRSLFFASELGALIQDIGQKTKGLPFRDVLLQVINRILRDPSDGEAIQRDYDLLLAFSEQYDTIPDYLLAFATDKDRFAPFFRSDYRECPVDNSEEFLTISTIHSAKGLEWDQVFVVGLCEGNFPNDYFCKGMSVKEKEEYFNAEWKKMYVASTRARESLTLTFPASITRKGYIFQKPASRFIAKHIDDREARSIKPSPGYAPRLSGLQSAY